MITKLFQLLDENRAAPREIRAEASADAVSIYLSGVISADWGVGLAQLVEAWPADPAAPVNLYINSPGGDVFEARAMAAVIARHVGPVTSIIDGVAASAATYLALAGRTVRMSQGSMLMIHNSWALAMGDKAEMTKTAALLDKIDTTIAADYLRKTGATAEQVTAWMDAETWFTADEALAEKFIDAIDANTQASASAQWNLSAYDNAPKPDTKPEPAIDDLIAAQVQRLSNRLRLLDNRFSAPPHRTAA